MKPAVRSHRVTLACPMRLLLGCALGGLSTISAGVLTIQEWDVLGPFPVGKTEIDGDVLEANGGLSQVQRKPSGRVADRTVYFSEVAPRGVAQWTAVRGDTQGNVGVNWQVDWNQHVTWMDNMMALETQSYYLGALSVPKDAAGDYILHAPGVHSFTVDGVLYHGDIYSKGELLSPIQLTEGNHEVLVRFRARAAGQFKLQAIPQGGHAARPLQLTASAFSPDISSDGLLIGEWLPLPLLNAGNKWVRDLKVTVSAENHNGNDDGNDAIGLHPDYMQPTDGLAPGV